ncbi:MAG: ATP-dependent Clp protease ATP-binding subunit, partial [Candidatus Marinimicrobia bacterium]|nr:ATP-dependent Clp protease ATP-binding subunit [Candidatus Neomarinimicrobiota bacterium]
GVGKTELTKSLTKFLFDDEKALIRVDMSEYMERHSISKMIGSPPGYVGHEEGGSLTEKIRHRPYSVVLFDEIEKADDKVLTSMLRLLDEGIISDNQGRELHFEDAVLILTTNAGSVDLAKEKIGFGCSTEDGTKILTQYFRPEFINRVNIVFFKSLIREDIYEIIRLKTGDILNRLDFSISINEDFYANVAENIVSTRMGAREVERAVEDELLTIASGNKNVLLSKTA